MNRSLLKASMRVLVWSGLLALSTAVALAQDSAPASGQRSDGQIEMDVVRALDASPALKNDLITAATIQGDVTLAGTVSSDASKQLAESIVKKVPGVTGVHNNLTIGNPQDAQNGAAPAALDDNDVPQSNPQPPANAQSGPPQPNSDQGQYSQPAPPPNQYPDQAQQGQYPPPPNQYPGQEQGYPPQGRYPQQGQYPPPPYPPGRPQYAPYPQQPGYNRPPAPSYEFANGPVTIPAGTLLQLRTSEALASKRAKDGEPVQFTLISDVTFGGVLAIPKGATLHGVITESRQAGSGQLAGHSELALTLTSLDLAGQNYPLTSDEFKVKGPNKAGETVGNAIGAGLVGTIIGCAVGRGTGCAIGAGAGVAAGTAATAASSGPGVWIPAEALVSFHLRDPLTVNPVSQDEAARLAEGLYPGGPTLYRRGPRPYYGPRVYYGYGYPYYPYPPVYYRPYYMVGGVYYWR